MYAWRDSDKERYSLVLWECVCFMSVYEVCFWVQAGVYSEVVAIW